MAAVVTTRLRETLRIVEGETDLDDLKLQRLLLGARSVTV